MKLSEGFSLVEILIVIAILAILGTITYIQYYGINSRARDSARRSDIYEISTALEVNKTPQGYVSLQGNQFSSFQWQDSQGNVYCIASGTPVSPSVSSAWGGSCPSGFMTVAPGTPPGNFTAWKICTFLENPSEGEANIFCKTSRQ